MRCLLLPRRWRHRYFHLCCKPPIHGETIHRQTSKCQSAGCFIAKPAGFLAGPGIFFANSAEIWFPFQQTDSAASVSSLTASKWMTACAVAKKAAGLAIFFAGLAENQHAVISGWQRKKTSKKWQLLYLIKFCLLKLLSLPWNCKTCCYNNSNLWNFVLKEWYSVWLWKKTNKRVKFNAFVSINNKTSTWVLFCIPN